MLAMHTTHRLPSGIARLRSIRTKPPLPRINTPRTRRRSRRIPSQSPTVQQQTIKQKTSRRNRKHKQKLDQGIRGVHAAGTDKIDFKIGRASCREKEEKQM